MLETATHIYFFTKNDIYSNFYPVNFEHQGIRFRSSEHAVMYRKAMLFGAKEIADEILDAPTPQDAKKFGRSKQIPFDEETWRAYREEIYLEVLRDKFSTPALKKMILATGNKIFAEASPYDKIWGIGLAITDPRIYDRNKWLGENLLGITLMNVRDDLRALEPPVLIVGKQAEFIDGSLKGLAGQLVGYNSSTGEIEINVDDVTSIVSHVSYIKQ